MPGMPIFQDSPTQLKGQIYVEDSSNNVVPLQLDASSSLPISGEVSFAAGSDISTVSTVTTVGTITNDVPVINGTSAFTVGLASGTDLDTVSTVTTVGTITNDVPVVNGTSALTVGLASGTDLDTVSTVTTVGTITNDVSVVNGTSALTVGLAAGSNLIGKVESQLVFTSVDSFGAETILTPQSIGIGATVSSNVQDISTESSFNWFIKNTGTIADQNITLIVELSPDQTNWVADTGTVISLDFGVSKMITVTNFLQYVRFTITGGTALTDVISCYQAQH